MTWLPSLSHGVKCTAPSMQVGCAHDYVGCEHAPIGCGHAFVECAYAHLCPTSLSDSHTYIHTYLPL